MFGRRPSNERVIKVTVYAGDPIADPIIASLDRRYGAAMGGRSGRIVAGENYNRRHTGDSAPLQAFRGGANIGGATTARPSANRGLPATAAPPRSGPNPVIDLLAQAPA